MRSEAELARKTSLKQLQLPPFQWSSTKTFKNKNLEKNCVMPLFGAENLIFAFQN